MPSRLCNATPQYSQSVTWFSLKKIRSLTEIMLALENIISFIQSPWTKGLNSKQEMNTLKNAFRQLKQGVSNFL